MMNRLIFAAVLAFVGISGWAQEQDSTESVNKLVELQEVIVKGGLPNTRLKAGAMVTRIEGTPLAQSGTLARCSSRCQAWQVPTKARGAG